ncbi:endonuclease domain-containing 1 protein [Rhinichthys klamathensis goyatoka]|uniref:endonuclease domain-containing 1 protein n=1 Tax=Rhinichthys klamathensis goyatoka TaxID=3034132 RepID=UPI0024B4D10A|nr:endonuclease domain-containing 1 protein [Rhinichthys klamathensis goyatoka]
MKHLVFLLLPLFTLSEVVDDFSKCNQFFFNFKPPIFTPANGNKVQHICQCLWNDKKEPIFLYATLYSTTWKIPVYSAYVFGSPNIGRCDAWYIEPQLDGKTKPNCMQPKGYVRTIGTNQALKSDYEDSGFDKGHLYPVLHTNNHLSMLATSTLTNAAPQDPDFNQGSWLQHERAVIKDLQSCDKAYVVTGVVPDLDHEKIYDKITVSKYYWRATYCQKGNQLDVLKGYYGPDNNGKVQQITIEELEEWLKKLKEPITIKIFPTRKRQRE